MADDCNALILLPKPKATDAGVLGDAAAERKLSSSQKRKLKKVQEEKEKRANRAQVGSVHATHVQSGPKTDYRH